MKSSKILGLAVASALGVTANSVWAVTPIDGTTVTPLYYASENVSVEAGTSIVLGDTLSTKIGASVPTTAPRYIRVDFTGVKFTTELSAAQKTAAIVVAGIPAALPVVGGTPSDTFSSGGALNGTHFINSVAAPNDTTSVPDATVVTIDLSGVGLTMTGAEPTIQYRLFETETCAGTPTTVGCAALYDSTAKKIIGLKPAVKLSTTSLSQVASVASDYKKFKATGADVTFANIGTAQIGIDGTVYLKTGALVTNAQGVNPLLAANTKLTLKGDFAAYGGTSRVYVDTAGCADPMSGTGIAAAISTDKTSATATLTTVVAVDALYNVCLIADGATQINASGYAVDLVPVTTAAVTNTTAIQQTGKGLGSITRDGVVLRSGFVSRFGIGVSRFILANTGTSDVQLTSVKFFGNADGATVQPTLKLTLPHTLKANSRNAIELANLVDLTTMPLQNTMVEFNINATSEDAVFGTYQLLLAGSTVQTVVPLERVVSKFRNSGCSGTVVIPDSANTAGDAASGNATVTIGCN